MSGFREYLDAFLRRGAYDPTGRDQAIADLRQTLTNVRALVDQWHEDQRTYPAHVGGEVAAAAVRCCAKELTNVLDGRDRSTRGIAAEIVSERDPAIARGALEAMLALEPDRRDGHAS